MSLNSYKIAPNPVDKTLFTTQGDMAYATGANTPVRLAKGTALQQLRMNSGATAPEWATPTGMSIQQRSIEDWMANVEIISRFQVTETWTSGAGTQSSDATNVKIGSASLKILENDNTAGFLYSDRSSLSLNLALFNAIASSTDDYIRLVFYISDVTKVDTAAGKGVIVMFETSGGNDYEYSFVDSLATGWNYKYVAKSAFTGTGSPDWANITKVEVGWYSLINSQNAYVSFQLVDMVKKDPSSSIPNMFQHRDNNANVRDFAINSGAMFVGSDLDGGPVIVKALIPTGWTGHASTASDIVGTVAYTDDFALYMKQVIKTANSSNSLVWEVDASNHVGVLISSSNVYLYSTISGSDSLSTTAAYTCAVGDIIEFELYKHGTSWTAYITKNYDKSTAVSLTKEIALTGNGYLSVATEAAANVPEIHSVGICSVDFAMYANKANWAASVGIGCWKLIRKVTLAADAAQVDINIPSNYKFINVFFIAKASAGTTRDLHVRGNGIATNTYGYTITQTTSTGVSDLDQGGSFVGQLVLTNALTNGTYSDFSVGNITFCNGSYAATFDYATTVAGAVYKYNGTGTLSGVATINYLSFIASADSIESGSLFYVFGVEV